MVGRGCLAYGLRVLGFRIEGFRGLGFRVEGFRGLGTQRSLGFRVEDSGPQGGVEGSSCSVRSGLPLERDSLHLAPFWGFSYKAAHSI